MHQAIEEYLADEAISYDLSKGKWFNANAYYHQRRISIQDFINSSTIHHSFEFNTSEYYQPSSVHVSTNLASKVSVHTEIQLLSYSTKNFKIEKINYILSLFNSVKKYQVKSKNNGLKNSLQKSTVLKEFFELFSNDPEFDPLIKTVIKNHTSKIFIDFECRVLTPNYIPLSRKLSSLFNELISD